MPAKLIRPAPHSKDVRLMSLVDVANAIAEGRACVSIGSPARKSAKTARNAWDARQGGGPPATRGKQ